MGGVGIEAISRGAQSVYFVDSSQKGHCDHPRKPCHALKSTAVSEFLKWNLHKALQIFEREGTAFDIAFLDPPYDREDLYTMALESFGARPLLKEEGILVMEHSKRQEPPATAGFLQRYRIVDSGGQLPVLLPEERVTTAIYPGSFDPLTFRPHRYSGTQCPAVRSRRHRHSHEFAEGSAVHH